MKKVLVVVLSLLFVLSMFGGCQKETPSTSSPAAQTSEQPSAQESEPETNPLEGMKIAYFVSDMRETFHQAQYAEAKKYAMEKYGIEVVAFDGKGDSNVMTANIDQIIAQGMDAATLHIWDNDAAMPGINACLEAGIKMASFFSPIPETGLPVVRNDEAGVSEQMGKAMAEQWKAANPDKPIVMVQLGWPNHTEVKSGRTDPFVKGVLSVDPTATDLGCQDASAGSDAAKQIMKDLGTQHPEVNLIYAESGGLAVGVMAALNELGRGKVGADGKPTTELVASCDFDEVQMKAMFDSDSSLKYSLGLPPIETAHTRIDVLVQLINEEIAQVGDTETEYLAKGYFMSGYDMDRAEAVEWLNTQFGLSLS